jgi:hypothetical protein
MQPGAVSPGSRHQTPRTSRSTTALLIAALAGIGLLSAREPSVALEPALEACFDRIERAFREEDPAALRPLLSTGTKVLIALESFGRPRQWYTADQVTLLLGEIFKEFDVTGFSVDRSRGSLSGTNVYFVPASWSCRAHAAGTKHSRLQLMLVRDGSGGAFQIREIKEVR